MDEANQETVQTDLEAVSKEFDCGTLKKTAEESEKPSLSSKSSSDVSSSEAVVEANTLSTNGIDNVDTYLGVVADSSFSEPKSDVELGQQPEIVMQSDETSKKDLNKEFSDVTENIGLCSDEFISSKEEKNNEISEENNCSVESTKKIIDSNINSNSSDSSQKNKEKVLNLEENAEKVSELEKLSENISSTEQTDKQDLNENNESSENINTVESCKKEDEETQEQQTNFETETELNIIKECSSLEESKETEATHLKEKDTDNKECHNKTDTISDESSEVKELENKELEEDLLRVSPANVDSSVKDSEKSEEADKDHLVVSSGNTDIEITENEKSKEEAQVSPENVNLNSRDPDKCEDLVQNEENKKQSTSSDSEVEKDILDFDNKNDSVHEAMSSQSTVNTSGASAEQDEENTNKSEQDGNEIMDTEIVNCNEIEQIDFSESDSHKDKEIDRIGFESSETEAKGENKDEEMVVDLLDTVGEDKINLSTGAIEIQREIISVESEANNQPGNSEEETITGDTSNQQSAELEKGKDAEVCIIPDDMTPRLSILPQNKEIKNSEGDVARKSEFKILRVSTPELEKPKTRLQEKKNSGSDGSKPRPVRNAAKLAGNKIKSLVENDLVLEDQSAGDVEGENEIQENANESAQICAQCREVKICKFVIVHGESSQYLCSEQCSAAFKSAQMETESGDPDIAMGEIVRKCANCHSQITIDERCLFWETMDFCNEDCLGGYQTELGSNCANCKGSVSSSSLGKYCVRFGYDVKQFCSAQCLEEYKKGLKVCSYCQKDISTGIEGFLAPVGDKGQFKDFCTQSCMEKYERLSSNAPPPDVIEECAVCSNSKPVRVEVELDNKTHKLCSEPCFAAFKFVNNITEGQCDMCCKYFDRAKTQNFSLFYDESLRSFCCKTCMNVYILANRKIVPCNWCKVKKYNFDMIKKVSANGQVTMMCSLNCFMLYQVSVNAVCSRRVKCDFCLGVSLAQYHLTMSDATMRNFCSYNCVMSFQNRYPKQSLDLIPGAENLGSPIPTGGPKKVIPRRPQVESPCGPVISSVQSLASNGPASPSGRVALPRADLVPQVSQPLTTVASIPAPTPQVYQQIITKPAPAKQMKNKSVLCKPYSHTKGVSCRPHPCMKETQTDQSLNRKFLIPIPVPIYVPAPMHMFATPFPVPVPFPLPIPVPVFIPTTRNSAKGIFKEIKKIQEKIPTDPFEAELLMMAEMVAGDKKQDPTDSESEDGNDGDDGGDGTFSPENVDTSNTFGDDMLQMALKMASELEEPAVDMESVLTSNTITTSSQPPVDPSKALYASDPDDPDQVHVMSMNRGRKRSVRGARNSAGGTPSKRGRRTSGSVDVPLLPPPDPAPPPRLEVEKPDANMCLKYTFGVNAWRHWVMQKNAELEKVAMTNRKIKLFKPELLQLTSDELNFSLCLFVKEVRKPNGTEYAPDTIYYLCLGIQQYLFENGRIDNIFTDSYYEKFTDCLDEVAKKFAALYNDSQYIVTRVEEEHLWESKQLGAHSPHVLLSTLMFFNTKHFNLVTVEEHMQLSFSHIMKHWKRNPNTPGVAKVPGSRNVLLRFYPPQSALEANSRKKKVYEQQENEENPLRCPVKLYEFYLSKCPESVKTRNDVFYLLPERSCVPDSPVWYSTMALGKEPLMKMLHRVKMVKEINIALLTC